MNSHQCARGACPERTPRALRAARGAALTLALIASASTKIAELASCAVRAEEDHLVAIVAVILDEMCLPSPRLGI
jgi:hypothetical protein